MKPHKFGIMNLVYLILTIGAILAFLSIFNIDRFVNCSRIDSNNMYEVLVDQVYVPIDIGEEKIQLIMTAYEEALTRNTELYGGLVGEPTIIITTEDDEAIEFSGNYVGATHNSVFGLYIIIGPDGLNVDVISHELAHSEISARVGWYKTNKIPIWFNEGVATQVDYRYDYSQERWDIITNNGLNVLEVKQFDTPEEFYNSDFELMVNNYTLAKQEVNKWLDIVGSDGLKKLIVEFKDGEDLDVLYSEMLLEGSRQLHN